MKIVALSDTHWTQQRDPQGRSLWDLEVPEGDVLVHAGDATFIGAAAEWAMFEKWWRHLPHKHKIFVPGNHDFHWANSPSGLREWPWLFKVGGLKWMAIPHTNHLPGWALQATEEQMHEMLARGGKVDVLVTHAPPFGMLDPGIHIGSVALFDYTFSEKTKPRVHIFGHSHEGFGWIEKNGVQFFNVAICNRDYWLRNEVTEIEVEVPPKGK